MGLDGNELLDDYVHTIVPDVITIDPPDATIMPDAITFSPPDKTVPFVAAMLVSRPGAVRLFTGNSSAAPEV